MSCFFMWLLYGYLNFLFFLYVNYLLIQYLDHSANVRRLLQRWNGPQINFEANRPKLCGNCTFPQNFHTKKLGEITVFFAVNYTVNAMSKTLMLHL